MEKLFEKLIEANCCTYVRMEWRKGPCNHWCRSLWDSSWWFLFLDSCPLGPLSGVLQRWLLLGEGSSYCLFVIVIIFLYLRVCFNNGRFDKWFLKLLFILLLLIFFCIIAKILKKELRKKKILISLTLQLLAYRKWR